MIRACLAALRQQLCDREGHILRFRLPGVAFHDAGVAKQLAVQSGYTAYRGRPGYTSFAIDLTQDSATLMRRLNGKWRADLRFAVKSDLTLERGFDTAFQARFAALFVKVQEKKGFRPEILPEFHFDLFASSPDQPDYDVDILIACKNGEDVAGIVVGSAGGTATYLFGATADPGRPLRAGYFLTWEAIRLAQQRGLRWYDLGGVDFQANPDVARFKERMGGTAIETEVFEARPEGIVAKIILGLERLRSRIRHRI